MTTAPIQIHGTSGLWCSRIVQDASGGTLRRKVGVPVCCSPSSASPITA